MKLYPDAWLLFERESGRVRTPASARSQSGVIRLLQAQHPNKPVSRFTEQDLVRFVVGDGLAGKTQQHRRTIVTTVFGWLKANGYTNSNPAAELKFLVSPPRNPKRQGNWYDQATVSKIIRACPDDLQGRRDRLALMFGFMLGLRLDALASLRWEMFSADLAQMELIVKGNKPTRKGVPAQIRSELSDWAVEKPESAVGVLPRFSVLGIEERRTEVLWDRPLGRTGITNLVRRAGDRVGLRLAPHDMRRSYAGMLEERGVKVEDIQRALDHSNVGTTSTYLDKNPAKAAAITGGFTLDI